MVRMSDLVRGIVRDARPAPAPPPAAGRPAPETSPAADAAGEPAERPAVLPTRRVSLASTEPAEPVAPAAPPSRAPAEPSEPSAPLFAALEQLLLEARDCVHGGAFPWARLEALVDRAAASLAASPDLFWVAHDPAASTRADPVAFHQARVCVLTLRLGATLGYDPARLRRLGLAAALFDAGLWELPPSLVERADALAGQELAAYRSHPRLSAAIVERWSPPDPRIVTAILDHHEREKGQGFPRGLQGAGIDPDARIIGLVDAYMALTVPSASRPRLRPHEAIRDIVKTRGDQFAAPLIKAILSEISVFPPGTMVRLNTEEVGRVVAVNRHHPLRPQVDVVFDGKGRRLATPRIVDLAEAPFVYITGPVGEDGR
jgi:HD-GYP domain-containing protein (c-di-GMP phosphodiesterase class II)